MREAPRLARPPIDRNPHINDILDTPEQIIQIAIAHVEGHVADEESLCRFVEGAVGYSAGVVAVLVGLATVDGILDCEAAALEVLEVVKFDGFSCGGDVLECYVAESDGRLLVVVLKLIESFARRVEWDW